MTKKLRILKDYLNRNRQFLINIYLFVNVLGFILWRGYGIHRYGRLDFIEISFIVQNLVLAAVILIRRNHIAIDGSIKNQIVAVIAFFSGIAFMGQPATSDTRLIHMSQVFILFANLFGIVTLLNLGRSFGILIAFRKVKTKGLYGIIRHPMYATDILLRIGFIISHLNFFTSVIFVLSTSCYIYRAILEERFLSRQPEYRLYMEKVRYRFIPYVF